MSETAPQSDCADMLPLKKWLREIGVTASTAWRWRKAGLLKTINIYGRIYITRKAREDFLARAEAGDFAQEPVTPKRGEGRQSEI